jgi:hypothetical protein
MNMRAVCVCVCKRASGLKSIIGPRTPPPLGNVHARLSIVSFARMSFWRLRPACVNREICVTQRNESSPAARLRLDCAGSFHIFGVATQMNLKRLISS